MSMKSELDSLTNTNKNRVDENNNIIAPTEPADVRPIDMDELVSVLSQRTTWLMLDSIRLPDCKQKIYELQDQPELYQLYQNSPLDAWLDQSPILVKLNGPDRLFTHYTNTTHWRSSAVLITTESGKLDFVKHLQSLLYVVNGFDFPTIFRIYSPKVLGRWLSTSTEQEVGEILGPVRSAIWFAPNSHKLKTVDNFYPTASKDPYTDKHWYKFTRTRWHELNDYVHEEDEEGMVEELEEHPEGYPEEHPEGYPEEHPEDNKGFDIASTLGGG